MQETALQATTQVVETRRFERTSGVKLTSEEYGNQLLQTALNVPIARGVGGTVTKVINRMRSEILLGKTMDLILDKAERETVAAATVEA